MLPAELDLERIEALIASLAVEIERGLARWLDLVAEFDRREGARAAGFRGTAEWLAWRCGLDRRTAREHVRVARRLRAWPRMRAAHAAGDLSYSKLRALARAPEDADEVALVRVARASTAAQLEAEVRQLRTAPSADLAVANAAHAARYLDWEWEEDGSLRFHGRLAGDEAAAFIEAIETAAEALHPVAHPEGAEGDDRPPATATVRPPLGARRADALTEAATSGAPRAQVVLHVDADALACTAVGDAPRAGTICALEGGPAVPSETARRLACDGESVGDLGRRRRVVSPSLRRSLERRDGGCRFPGCERRHGLHAHHVEHWAHGGATDRDNLVLLCRFHHRLVHEGGFAVARAAGEPVFLTPDGEIVPDLPPPAPEVPAAPEAVAA